MSTIRDNRIPMRPMSEAPTTESRGIVALCDVKTPDGQNAGRCIVFMAWAYWVGRFVPTLCFHGVEIEHDLLTPIGWWPEPAWCAEMLS